MKQLLSNFIKVANLMGFVPVNGSDFGERGFFHPDTKNFVSFDSMKRIVSMVTADRPMANGKTIKIAMHDLSLTYTENWDLLLIHKGLVFFINKDKIDIIKSYGPLYMMGLHYRKRAKREYCGFCNNYNFGFILRNRLCNENQNL